MKNVVSCFKPMDKELLKVGLIGMFCEGVMGCKIRIISRTVENNWLSLELENLEPKKENFLPKTFSVGCKLSYKGYVGWSIHPLDERN